MKKITLLFILLTLILHSCNDTARDYLLYNNVGDNQFLYGLEKDESTYEMLGEIKNGQELSLVFVGVTLHLRARDGVFSQEINLPSICSGKIKLNDNTYKFGPMLDLDYSVSELKNESCSNCSEWLFINKNYFTKEALESGSINLPFALSEAVPKNTKRCATISQEECSRIWRDWLRTI